jgi:uncharacterized protein (DUF1330 family)
VVTYVISEVEILDEMQGQRYRELAATSIVRHGGRYIVRGAVPEMLEGDWPTGQRVVIEFSTMEQLQRWYNSAEYAEALAVSQTALSRCLLFVEDVSDQK